MEISEDAIDAAMTYSHDLGFDEGYELGWECGYQVGYDEGVDSIDIPGTDCDGDEPSSSLRTHT